MWVMRIHDNFKHSLENGWYHFQVKRSNCAYQVYGRKSSICLEYVKYEMHKRNIISEEILEEDVDPTVQKYYCLINRFLIPSSSLARINSKFYTL